MDEKIISEIQSGALVSVLSSLVSSGVFIYLGHRLIKALDENTERGHRHESRLEKIETDLQWVVKEHDRRTCKR